MSNSGQGQRSLEGVRVIEISALSGAVCGRTLADMGAEVIKLEPAGGETARQDLPLIPMLDGSKESAAWIVYNLGKRSVTADLDTSQGLSAFKQMVKTADIVIVDFQRLNLDEMDRLAAIARQINPKLVWTEITPFGRGHAYEHTPATDTTLQALGGHLYQNGDVDRPPVRIGVPVGLIQAGAEAANAALMAYYHALRGGEGQRVDISVQECVIWTLLNTTMAWQILSLNELRGGALRKERSNQFYTRLVWPCQDGYVVFGPVGGGGGSARVKSYDALLKWMAEDGIADEILTGRDWNGDGQFFIPQQDYDHVTDVICRFIATKTLVELTERAVRDRILMAPINSLSDILSNPQHAARHYFEDFEDRARGIKAKLPTNWVRMSQTPLQPPAPAPRAGADSKLYLQQSEQMEDAQ